MFPLLFYLNMIKQKQLDIFIDESGDFSLFSEKNPIYSVAFVMVSNQDDNTSPINKFNNYLDKLFGGEHFVHVGNLVRGEKPYKGMLREERWNLFYTLFLLAKYSKYEVSVPTIIKSNSEENTLSSLAKAIIEMIDCNYETLKKNKLVIHYDFGQGILAGLITSSFLSRFPDSIVVKTTQAQDPFMQIADLFAYFKLLQYKIDKGYLTNSENRFFGGISNLKKNYLKTLDKKYLK